MKIYNTAGEELTERPDYSKGRLLQDLEDPEKYIFSPWDEVPLREEEVAPDTSVSLEAKVDALTDVVNAMVDA